MYGNMNVKYISEVLNFYTDCIKDFADVLDTTLILCSS